MHGGDIYRNQVQIDFSVNTNPMGAPEEVTEAMMEGVRRAGVYPDPECRALREAIGRAFDMNPERVVCGNGAAELLMAVCRWKNPNSAMLPAPGFSEYARALEAAGCRRGEIRLREEDDFRLPDDLPQLIRTQKPDLLFLTNPANPTGVLTGRKELWEILRACGETDCLLLLDECFMELSGRGNTHSMTQAVKDGNRNLMILRSFTKSFAVPGIRLGYLLCGDALQAEGIERQLPAWNVSVPAQLAGEAAMRMDFERYLELSTGLIRREREFLTMQLQKLGAVVYPSEADYVLFRWKSGQLFEELLAEGILIRDCRDYEGLCAGFYRVAVKKHDQNEILIKAIQKIVRNGGKTGNDDD